MKKLNYFIMSCAHPLKLPCVIDSEHYDHQRDTWREKPLLSVAGRSRIENPTVLRAKMAHEPLVINQAFATFLLENDFTGLKLREVEIVKVDASKNVMTNPPYYYMESNVTIPISSFIIYEVFRNGNTTERLSYCGEYSVDDPKLDDVRGHYGRFIWVRNFDFTKANMDFFHVSERLSNGKIYCSRNVFKLLREKQFSGIALSPYNSVQTIEERDFLTLEGEPETWYPSYQIQAHTV